MVDANTTNDLAKMETGGQTKAAGIGFDYNSYGGYPTNPITFWVDNVSVVTAATPPPPPPPPTLSISPTVQGLNLFTGNGGGLYNREDLEASNANYSWVGASGPVSYSFTLTNYPVGTNDAVQCQIFLVPNPGTENDPDWTEPNVIFLDLENNTPNGGGATWNFRYKTNEPNGNTMIYGSGALASIGTNTALGTWTLTFNNNTNVTMTVPGGASTNFNLPDPTGATAALFSNGVDLYFGAQAGNTGGASDHIVASDFSVSGIPAAFNDNFVADAGTLNSNIWTVNAAYTNTVLMIGPGNPYWVSWTAPAVGFSLDATASLSNPLTNANWVPVLTYSTIQNGSYFTQLISTNDLPGTNAAFFSLIQRTFTQLLVLLPGQTNAPGTATGITGTPPPVDIQSGTQGGAPVTVLAVDSRFYPVGGVTDNITLSSTDTGGTVLNGANPAAMVNGVASFNWYFVTPGAQTVTATDNTETSIQPATSQSVQVLNQ
jgi:hypothetical protein